MIWLVGRDGMLGRLVETELARLGVPFHASGRECDVTDGGSIARNAPTRDPAWLVNCTAYTAVDAAETEREAAYAVNDRAVALLARYCAERGARMLHVSTDYVFDGENAAGYAEDAETAPINTYGASKEAGEKTLRAALAEHVIVRTAWLYAEHGRNFMNTVLRLLTRENGPTIVDDQHGSPTYALDLARCITTVVSSPEPTYGTYHFTNAGETTWFGFAREIRERAVELGLVTAPPEIKPIPSESYPTPAARPRHSVLRHDRITREYGVTPRAWQEALAECLARKKQNEEQEGQK
ncbi:MAG: dTDP-4-dehydrorhamnose reductase [Spirochaetaceae bacterium]|nr:MAG: dTDP-4-dehydrorhamnose reductase [Spirochaetaceae bacterium]